MPHRNILMHQMERWRNLVSEYNLKAQICLDLGVSHFDQPPKSWNRVTLGWFPTSPPVWVTTIHPDLSIFLLSLQQGRCLHVFKHQACNGLESRELPLIPWYSSRHVPWYQSHMGSHGRGNEALFHLQSDVKNYRSDTSFNNHWKRDARSNRSQDKSQLQMWPKIPCIGLPIYASDLGLSKLRFAVPAVALQPYLTIHLLVDFMVLLHSIGH